jgi:autotransporter-associated beta strand protein
VFDGGALRTLASVTSARSVTLNAGNGLIDTYGFNSTFSGAFTGVGGLIKAGQGVLTLSGVNTYTGGTLVMGGEVALQGALSGTTYVGPAGVLSGSGLNTGPLFLGGGVVRPGGANGTGGLIAQAVSAGAGPGVLTVGQFSAPAGGVLQISFNGPSSTALNVLGAANINGVNLVASLASGGSLRFDQRYVVLSSGGLTGAFTNAAGWSSVGASSPGSVERLRYDLVANSVVLEVISPLDWTSGATNVNQRAVGALFNATQLTGSDAWIAGLNAASGNSSSDRLINLEAVSGEGDVDARFLSTSVDRKFNELVASRMLGGDLTGAPRTFAENTLKRFTPGVASMIDLAGVAAAGGVTRNTSDQAWTQVYLVNDKLSTGLAPTKATGAGLGAGYDVVLGSGDLRVGFAVAYAQGDERTLSLGTHATGDYWQGALYARKQYGPWLFGRNLTLAGGGYAIVTNGSTNSTDLSLQALAARQFLFQGGWKLTASGVLQASQRDQSAFTEHGVGPFALNVGSVHSADFEGLGELLLSRKFAAEGGDKSPDASIGFQGSPGSAIRIQGAANVNSWAGATVGASFITADKLKLSARYEASLSNQIRESAAVFSLSTRW